MRSIFFLLDKIKDLEYELKKSKITSMHKKKEKKMLSLDSTTKPNTGKCKKLKVNIFSLLYTYRVN